MTHIDFAGFSSSEVLNIRTRALPEAVRQYGYAVRAQVRNQLGELQKRKRFYQHQNRQYALQLLSCASMLADTPVCVVGGVSWLKRYMDVFRSFCQGAGISELEGAMLQIGSSLGCQTIITREPSEDRTYIIHTEENGDDPDLRRMYRLLQRSQDTKEVHPRTRHAMSNAYKYRMVDVSTDDRSYTFFAYPSLCFGGPAMGMNKTTGMFLAVDALYTKKIRDPHALWVNAVVSMMFDCGDLNIIERLLSQMKDAGLSFVGGYAVHLVSHTSVVSYELGGSFYVQVEPDTYGKRQYIAQTNYPRSAALRSIDELTPPRPGKQWPSLKRAQLSLEMRRRTDRLDSIARHVPFPQGSFPEVLAGLGEVLADPTGDIETSNKEKTYVGFVNYFMAGYSLGYVTGSQASFVFGKQTPASDTYEKYWYWYDINQHYDAKYAGADLYLLAQEDMRQRSRRQSPAGEEKS